MKTKIMIAFLVITLAACAPAQTNTANIQNTAVAIVQTGVALTQTAMPTATLPPPTFTPTALPTSLPPATPTSTQPIVPIITPDAIQMEKWKEYQTELAKALFSFTPKFPARPKGHDPDEYKNAVCEWDILGRSKQEVYVWAVCGPGGIGDFNPTVIHLEADGSIQNVKVFGAVGQPHDLPIYDLDPFPVDVQEKLCLYYLGFTANTQCDDSTGTQIDRLYVLLSHLKYREGYAEEPPLVVLSALPTSTPAATATPTQPIVPIITPDAIEVERWQEYQTELAKSLLPKDSPGYVLCEWVILGQSGQEVYVAAVCLGSGRATAPAVIYLSTDDSIQNVEAVEYGSTRTFNIQRLFPSNVQEMLYSESMHVIYERLVEHLDWRFSHREELPLIVLSATPVP